jgi:ethanolamine utilization microcompartment shell protein EutS
VGREARCECRWPGGSGEVKALLEATEIILRGSLRRTLAIADLSDVRVDGDDLVFSAGEDRIELTLGSAIAAKWAKKVAEPPPTLAQKLGIAADAKAYVIGTVTVAEVAQALDGALTAVIADAAVALAVVGTQADLEHALALHQAKLGAIPLWVVHRKGPKAISGDAAVRVHLRGNGYVDTKSCAVSPEYSATRYSVRKN